MEHRSVYCYLPVDLNLVLNGFFRPSTPPLRFRKRTLNRVKKALIYTVFLLILGHGWLNLIQKPGIIGQYAHLGFSNPVNVSIIVGIFEILAAITVLIKPTRPLIMIFLVWKMGTELFYPHYEIFEWVERGGSYGTLLALWFCLDPLTSRFTVKESRWPLTVDR